MTVNATGKLVPGGGYVQPASGGLRTSPDSPLKQEQLRLNLGLPPWLVRHLVCRGTLGRKLLDVVSVMCTPVEILLIWLLSKIPVSAKHRAQKASFSFWVALHKVLPAYIAKRGLAQCMSIEAHALNNIMWWSRLMTVTLRRMRFGLSAPSFSYPPSPGLKEEMVHLPERGVRGAYLHTAPPGVDDPPVLLWFFGGAFFGGSFMDQHGLAERYARRLGCDVFLAHYSLCPEHTIQEAYRDGCRAYEWLLTKKAPERVAMLGVSSGGGVCLRVLQLASAPEAERRDYFLGGGAVPQPAGAALIGPFVNFTVSTEVDPGNSLIRHQEMDLIVTQRVYDFVQPQLAAACGGEAGKYHASPLFKDMHGLCPILVSYSLHEACTDDCQTLIEALRKAGNDVEGAAHPYMSHAFPLLACFLPEGVQAEEEICEWIKRRGPAWGA